VVGVTLLLAGCGGTQSESARVRAVVQRYEAAFVDRNASELCSLLSGETNRELAALLAGQGAKSLGCVGFANLLFRGLGHDAKVLAREARIRSVKVAGDRATVSVQGPGIKVAGIRAVKASGEAPAQVPGEGVREITLVRTQSGWKVTLPPAARSTYLDLRGGPAAITLEPPSTAYGGERAQFYFGRSVLAQTGCLACHRLGENGNAGPGPDLTHIGSKRSAAAIERAIINPTAPMPSFRNLPKPKLRALVTFLALLRE
jgi:hypothetical protein